MFHLTVVRDHAIKGEILIFHSRTEQEDGTEHKQHMSISPNAIKCENIKWNKKKKDTKVWGRLCVDSSGAERRGNALWDVLLSAHALDDCSTLDIKGIRRVFGLLDLWSTCLLRDENIDIRLLQQETEKAPNRAYRVSQLNIWTSFGLDNEFDRISWSTSILCLYIWELRAWPNLCTVPERLTPWMTYTIISTADLQLTVSIRDTWMFSSLIPQLSSRFVNSPKTFCIPLSSS